MADQLEKEAQLEQEELQQAKNDPKVQESKNSKGVQGNPSEKSEFIHRVKTVDENEGGVEGMSILKTRRKNNKLLNNLKQTTEDFASMVVEINSVGDNFSEAAAEDAAKPKELPPPVKE